MDKQALISFILLHSMVSLLHANHYEVYTADKYEYDEAAIATQNQFFTFSVKASKDAHLLLQNDPFEPSSIGYEIVLGSELNTASAIRNGTQGPHLSDHDEEILDGENYKEFWISWDDGIKVGKGVNPGVDTFLTHLGSPVYKVSSISISTGWGVDGNWKWPVKIEDLVRLSYVQQETEERKLQWMTVSGYSQILVRIRACKDASIALTEITGNTAVNASEIRIWADDNKISIHEKYGEDANTEVTLEDALSCEEFRTFWIRWTSQSISLGKGSEFHQDRIIEYLARNKMPPIYALGMASSNETAIDWELVKIQGETVTMRTPGTNETDNSHYMMVTPKDQSTTFRLKTCSQGGLSLRPSDAEEVTPGYEIAINENNEAIMRRFPDNNVVDYTTMDPTDCNLFKSYWVSWANSILQFGEGAEPGTLSLVQFQDPDPHQVNTVSFVSLKEHAGNWETSVKPGDKYRFFTYYQDYVDSPRISVVGVTSVLFNVQARVGARLTISTIHGDVSSLAHEVILGDVDNTQVNIIDRPTSTKLNGTNKENVVSDAESRPFWLSWKDGDLRVGEGSTVGEQELVGYANSLKDVTSLALATWNSATPGIWDLTFPDETRGEAPPDDTTAVKTLGDSQYKTTVTLNARYFVFDVKAASNAKIALSKIPGQIDSDTYKLEIGADGNTMTSITKLGEGGEGGEGGEVGTVNILSETEYRTFWVSMDGAKFEIGRGATPGSNKFLDLEESDVNEITAVSLTSSNDKVADWSFATAIGHEVFQETSTGSEDHEYSTWQTTHGRTSLIFQVQTAKNAYIALSNNWNDISSAFEVILGSENSDMVIIRSTDGNKEAEALHPGVITEEEYRTFWISWQEDKIVVGSGHQLGSNELLTLPEIDTTNINSVAVTSGKESQASWRISSIEANNFKVETSTEGAQGQVWIYHETNFFEFYLRAADFAKLYLTEVPMNDDNRNEKGWEITFGTTNPSIELRQNPGGRVLDSKNVEITSGLVKRKFWVSWQSNELRVGTGTLFENEVISAGISAYNVRAIALSTMGATDVGHWEFSRYSGSSTVVTTEAKTLNVAPRHWLDLTDTSALAFKVNSCGGISLLVADIMGSPFAEVIIGDTTNPPNKIINLSDGQTKDTDDTTDILACGMASWMWLSWDNQRLTIGQDADIGGSVILEWTEEDRAQIQSLAFRGLQQEPVFEFAKVPNRYYQVKTPGTADSQTVWLAMQQNSFSFDVQVKSNAMVILKEVPQDESDRAIIVLLGADENQNTRIYRADNEEDKEEISGAVLDEDQFISFYIQWDKEGDSRFVTVGKDGEQLLQYDMSSNPIDVNEISIQTQPNEGVWRFPDNSALVKTFYISPIENDQVIQRVAGRDNFIFKLRAPKDAHIDLFDHFDSERIYTIVIGVSGNGFTSIRNEQGDRENAYSEGILDENEFREFWISWRDGRIAVGRGRLPLFREIVSWADPNPMTVSYLSLSMWYDVIGYWQIHTIPDGTFLYTTMASTPEEELTIRLNPSSMMYDFSLKACSDAVVILKTAGASSSSLYKLIIGDKSNTMTTLLDSNDDLLHEIPTPGILNCYEAIFFHLSWTNNQLRLLEWNSGGRALFGYDTEITSDIHGLQLRSEVSAEWSVSQFEGHQLQYKSGPSLGNTDHCCLWETVQDRTFITFSVKACSHVSVLLTSVAGQTTLDSAFEVALGIDGQDKHEIRKGLNGDPLASSTSANLLSCHDHTTFWVSWTDTLTSGYISVGTGTTVDSQQILTYKNDQGPVSIGAYSVASEYQDTADFRLGTTSLASEFQVYTPDEYGYTRVFLAKQDESFAFSFKGCSDAHIFLQANAFDTSGGQQKTPGYEIVLGGYDNKESDIRNGSSFGTILEKATGSVLDCNSFNDFWVSWNDGVRVGTGIYSGTGQFLAYNTKLYDVQTISLSTGYGSDGYWKWPTQYDDFVRFSHPAQEVKQFQWISMPGNFEMVIRLRACQDVSIALVDTVGVTNNDAAEVRIGTDNKQSSIHEQYDGDASATNSTENILSCDEFRTFWMIWTSNSIYVGKGARLLEGIIISYSKDDGLSPVNAIGIASSTSSAIDFEFVKPAGDTASIRTPEMNDERDVYQRMIVSPLGPSVLFRLKTCLAGGLSLQKDVDSNFTSSPGYEIVINENEHSVLRRVPGGVVLATGPVIPEDCDNYRPYWIYWINSTIHFGAGLLPGMFELITYVDEDYTDIGAVSVDSLNAHPGYWEFFASSEDKCRYYTYQQDYLDSPQISVLGTTSMIFDVKAKVGARLTLSTVAGATSFLAHEVILGDNDNQQVVIYDRGAKQTLTSLNIDNVISEDEFRTFWLSWYNGNLQVGTGDQIGCNELLSYPDSLRDVTSVSLATWQSVVGIWELPCTIKDLAPPPIELTTASSTPGVSSTPGISTSTLSSTSPSTPSTTDPVGGTEPGGGLSTGETVGVVFGVIFAFIIIGLLVFLAERKFRKRNIETTPLVFRNSQFDDDQVVEMAAAATYDNNPKPFNNDTTYNEPSYDTKPIPSNDDKYKLPPAIPRRKKKEQAPDPINFQSNEFDIGNPDSNDLAFNFDSGDGPPSFPLGQDVTGDHYGEDDA